MFTHQKIIVMNKYQHIGLAVLRIGISILMMHHGYGKLTELISGEPIAFWSFTGALAAVLLFLAMFGELIAPFFILIGYKTTWAAIPAVITMAVAAFLYHAGDSLADAEHSLLYLIGFVAILLCGPGKWSIDGRKGM